jgi:hypothetical protein
MFFSSEKQVLARGQPLKLIAAAAHFAIRQFNLVTT